MERWHVCNRPVGMRRVVEGDIVSVRARVWDPSAPDGAPVSLDGLWKLVAHTAIVRLSRAARQQRKDRLAQARLVAPLSPSDEKTLQRDTKLLEADNGGADGADDGAAEELHPDKVTRRDVRGNRRRLWRVVCGTCHVMSCDGMTAGVRVCNVDARCCCLDESYVVELRERWDGTSKAKGDAALRHCAYDELRHAFAKGDLVFLL